jgi:hypothetical protein
VEVEEGLAATLPAESDHAVMTRVAPGSPSKTRGRMLRATRRS